MSDIVYSCGRKSNAGEIKVSLLVEHKSYPDKYTPVQVGNYIFSALLKQVSNKEPLSIIIPVLLYHGKGKWQYQTLNNLFENVADEWKQFLPNFSYIYNNLGEILDEQVETLNNKFLAASLLALKHSFQKDWLEQNALRMLLLTENASENLQKNFIVYLFGRGELNEVVMEKLLETLSLTLKGTVMSTLDIFIEKGRKEGKEEGKAEIVKNLLLTNKFTITEIANFANVAETFVQKVMSKI